MATGGRNTRQWMAWAFKARGCDDCGARPTGRHDMHGFQIHHLDPATKTRGYIQRNAMARPAGIVESNQGHDAFLAELMGCVTLCEDCHKEATKRGVRLAEQESLFHGTGEAWTLNGR